MDMGTHDISTFQGTLIFRYFKKVRSSSSGKSLFATQGTYLAAEVMRRKAEETRLGLALGEDDVERNAKDERDAEIANLCSRVRDSRWTPRIIFIEILKL